MLFFHKNEPRLSKNKDFLEEYSPVVQGAAEPGQVGPPAPPHLPPAGQVRPPDDPGPSHRKRKQFPSPPAAPVPAGGAGV